nr:MAG TPA: hypothetical protein [Caudoviricetes sp.]
MHRLKKGGNNSTTADYYTHIISIRIFITD